MESSKTEWRPIWWTTLTVTVTTTVIGGIMRLLERNLNKGAYHNVQSFFKTSQPDYYPLLYLLVSLFVTLAIVWIYKLLLDQMPKNWLTRGLVVGVFLFLVADLPDVVTNYYTTVLSGAAIWGMVLSSLASKLINGCILTYTYMRLSSNTGSE